MPKTRRDLDRDAKTEQILDVAERQLVAGGFPALSMAGAARELGVAQNAIYWYFPTRDHLFVAVLRRLLGRIMTRKPPAKRDFVDQAVWLVDRLAEFHSLAVACHERARSSAVVGEFEHEFQSLLHGLLVGALTPYLPETDLDVAASSVISTVEGTLLRGVPPREREAIVRFTLERLIAPRR